MLQTSSSVGHGLLSAVGDGKLRLGGGAAADAVAPPRWSTDPDPFCESGTSNTPDRLTVVVDRPEALIDWLSLTFAQSKLDEVRALMRKWYGVSDVRPGVDKYHRREQWDSGAFVLFSADGFREECNLRLTGEALSKLPVPLVECISALNAIGVLRGRRIDASVDLPRAEGLLLMDRIEAAMKSGQIKGFRKGRCIPDLDLATGEVVGRTLYLGSRDSNLMVRIYDKHLESDGVRSCVRFELSIMRGVAELAWKLLSFCDGAEDIARLIGRSVAGSFDVLDATGAHGHRSRMKRLPFWQEFVDSMGAMKLCGQRAGSTAVKKLRWLQDSCSKAFAAVCLTYEHQTGQDAYDFAVNFAQSLVDVGREKKARACECVAGFVDLVQLLTSNRDAVERWAPI